MKRHSESGLGLLAHLYQIRTPFFLLFQVFFKTNFNQVIEETKTYNQFKFFFHIDNICTTFVIQRIKKSNTARF